MAIVIEEEQKNKLGMLSIAGWFVILALIAVGAYYIFFKKPELIPLPLPGSAVELSAITLDPSLIVERPDFAGRNGRISPAPPASVGRSNPFIGF
ncbi:MAG: hypothetical protein AAB967_02840 [Patescibacteria group bacterium]